MDVKHRFMKIEEDKYWFTDIAFTITFTTWPANGRYCRKTIQPYQKYSSYFICDNDEIIERGKFCNFNFDCKDFSDEIYCSEETHFNCLSGFPPSIKRT